MPIAMIHRSTNIERTARVMQLEGLFDVPPSERSEVSWRVDLPIEDRDWSIGLIVGPSGCGKSTVARELFGESIVGAMHWPADQSIVDAFPATLGIKEITGLLSSVGFSSPPSWLRPFPVLSNGEQFRVTIARALANAMTNNSIESKRTPLLVVDEFTSVVDRTVAKVASFAVAKAVRRLGLQFIAVSCHHDIADWLLPDWTYEPATGEFCWRSLRQRPAIKLTIRKVHSSAWKLFHHHHYLDNTLNPSAHCFVGFVRLGNEECDTPAVFTAVLPFPHPQAPGWREHRTVCLPDFQGVGIGNAMSEFVAGMFRATGRPYRSVTSSPSMIRHRARSPLWKMIRAPSSTGYQRLKGFRRTNAVDRLTASFEFAGPALIDAAGQFGISNRTHTSQRKSRS